MTGPAPELRVRIPRANLIGVVAAAFATVPLAFTSPWLGLLWVIPLLGLVHLLRAGVDADATGLTRRTAFGSRRVTWDQLAGLRLNKSRITAVLRDGDTVRLPVLRPRHLPLVASVSGGRLPDPSAQ